MNSKLTRATVVYLFDKDNRVCLAQMKKVIHKEHKDKVDNVKDKMNFVFSDEEQEQIEYSLGVWNGYGGKETEEDIKRATAIGISDSMLCTAIRELREESGVTSSIEDLEKCGRVNFFLIDKSEDNTDKKFIDYNIKNREVFMQVYFYILRKWEIVPMESKEMGPATFFKRGDIPYHEMMPADKMLFEKMLNGESIDSDVILMGKDVKPIVKFVL